VAHLLQGQLNKIACLRYVPCLPNFMHGKSDKQTNNKNDDKAVSVEFDDDVMNNGGYDDDVTRSGKYGLENPVIVVDEETESATDTKL